ncbi:MAG: DJ-1/PfpI family protein [Acidobacteriota bacterium]
MLRHPLAVASTAVIAVLLAGPFAASACESNPECPHAKLKPAVAAASTVPASTDGASAAASTTAASTTAAAAPQAEPAAAAPQAEPAAAAPQAEPAAAAPQAEPATRDASDAKKQVGVLLYPGFEVLDVYGPVEMWGYVPEFELVMIAKEAGPVMSSHGIATVATHGFDDAPDLDLLMVPGGAGTFPAMQDDATLDFIRRQHDHAELTTSVCTGAMLLAATGILDGRRATSNKLFFAQARLGRPAVRWNASARWVDDGDIVTASGVTAGMDMALHVVARYFGRTRAEQLATGTEYIWNDDPDNDPFAASASTPAQTPASTAPAGAR